MRSTLARSAHPLQVTNILGLAVPGSAGDGGISYAEGAALIKQVDLLGGLGRDRCTRLGRW